MYANNEIGAVQPIREIAKVIRSVKKRRGGILFPLRTDEQGNPTEPKFLLSLRYFHTDACQAPGYLDLNVERLGVDLLTLNGSKIYGPKGIDCFASKMA